MKTTISKKQTALHFSCSTLLGAMLTLIINPSFAAIPNNSNASNADYDMTPPLTQTTPVKPNVIINFDNSGSMLVPAYQDRTNNDAGGWKFDKVNSDSTPYIHRDYDNGITYYGYFDSAANYAYQGDSNDSANTGFFYKVNTGSWNGNFLNWLTMRRIDIARKVLIGGKVKRCDSGTNHTNGTDITERCTTVIGGAAETALGTTDAYMLTAEIDYVQDANAEQRDSFKKAEDLSDSSNSAYTPHDENDIYWLKSGKIFRDNVSDADGIFDDDFYNVHIAVPTEPQGLIQNNQNDFRFGLAVFNYNHERTLDSHKGKSIFVNNKKQTDETTAYPTAAQTTNGHLQGVDGGTLYPCYPDLDKVTKASWGKYDTCLPTHVKVSEDPESAGDSLDNIVRVIEEYPLVWGTTPIAETLYEIYGYVAQKDHGINHATGTGVRSAPAGKYFFPNGQDKNTGQPSYKVSNAWDPYYYSEFSKKIYCCKTYVININDGAPFNDWDVIADMPDEFDTVGEVNTDGDAEPDGVAAADGLKGDTEFLDDLSYYIRTTDIRTDLTGQQSITSYFVYSALGEGAANNDLTRKMQEAAANGGFLDLDGDNIPDPKHPSATNTLASQSTFQSYITNGVCAANEWDRDADCKPDTYFSADSGSELESALTKALNDIRKEVASGTAASVLANSTDGIGTIYNSLYQPELQDSSDRVINWGGLLHALYIDASGFLREDNPTDGTRYTLDGYTEDRIVKFEYNELLQETFIKRYNAVDSNGDPVQEGTEEPLTSLNNIWEARDELAALTTPENQRTFTSAAQTGRYIFTGLDLDASGSVTSGETVDFMPASFDADNVAYNASSSDNVKSMNFLGLVKDYDGNGTANEATDAAAVVNYIRGKEISGMRNRTIDYGSGAKVWRLGDIVQSTPAVIAAPTGGFDTLYGDTTYRTFKDKYANRRQMVYVGANDGMLHAFNGGFWDSINKKYSDTPTGLTDHNLGTEIWAYVPQNLLPHLQWLTDTNYAHSYYVDGTPIIFDARIWNTANADTNTHPKGWGTLLAVNMRLGGAPFQIDLEGDGIGGADADDPRDDIIMRSSIMIFDITDPEVAPVLLAEVTHPDLGLTTSQPELVFGYNPDLTDATWDTPSLNQWFLFFGSGPDILDTVTRENKTEPTLTDNAQIFLLDLADIDTGTVDLAISYLGVDAQFVGDINAVDWNNDLQHDTLYFGTVGGTEAAPTGTLKRLDLTGTNGLSDVIDPTTMPNGGQPFPNKPTESFDIKNNAWIYAGSGRLFTATDVSSKLKQSFYGVKEFSPPSKLPGTTAHDRTAATSEAAGLQDVTGIRVFVDSGEIVTNSKLPTNWPASSPAEPLDTFQEMESFIDKFKDGWYIDFDANGTDPSGRVLSEATYYRQLVLFSSFLPGGDAVCNPLGDSFLYTVYGRTGTAFPTAGLPSKTCSICSSTGADETQSVIHIGKGQASKTILHRGTAITKLGTASTNQQKIIGVPENTGRQSWREISDLPAIAK